MPHTWQCRTPFHPESGVCPSNGQTPVIRLSPTSLQTRTRLAHGSDDSCCRWPCAALAASQLPPGCLLTRLGSQQGRPEIVRQEKGEAKAVLTLTPPLHGFEPCRRLNPLLGSHGRTLAGAVLVRFRPPAIQTLGDFGEGDGHLDLYKAKHVRPPSVCFFLHSLTSQTIKQSFLPPLLPFFTSEVSNHSRS